MGTLYVVATPIGNMEDITFRAVKILKQVPLIAAEDTRTTGRLLDHHQVTTPLTSYHEYNKDQKTQSLLEHLGKGNLALVSDAGTPGINDPGFVLIRAALNAGHAVVPIPGPSAPITALSASGLPTDAFLYLGYLPRKSSQRVKKFQEVRSFPQTLIFLESPHRMADTLQDMNNVFSQRQIVLAREMTKIHEEFFRGTVRQALQHFQGRKLRGEITVVVEGASDENQRWGREKLLKELRKQKELGQLPPSKIAKRLSDKSGWKRSTVYDLLNDLD